MKLSEERITWLREVLETAEYCHIGAWGGEETWDVQGDLEDALDDIAQLEAALIEIRPKQSEAIEMMRTNGFVIDDLNDRWQKCAFTLYNYLAEIQSIADIALGGE